MRHFFSALGVYNGKVYEALWERAQMEPLNRTEVSAAYEVKLMRLKFLPRVHDLSLCFRPLSNISCSAVRDWLLAAVLAQNYSILSFLYILNVSWSSKVLCGLIGANGNRCLAN